MDEALKAALEAVLTRLAALEAQIGGLSARIDSALSTPAAPPDPAPVGSDVAAQRALADVYRRPEADEWPAHWPPREVAVKEGGLPRMTAPDLGELTLRARYGITWAGTFGPWGPALEAAHAEVDRIAGMTRAEYLSSRYASVGGDFACGGTLTGLWDPNPATSYFGVGLKPENYGGKLTLFEFLEDQLRIAGGPSGS